MVTKPSAAGPFQLNVHKPHAQTDSTRSEVRREFLGRATKLQQTGTCFVHAPVMYTQAVSKALTIQLEGSSKVCTPGVRVTGGTQTGKGMAETMQEEKASRTKEEVSSEMEQGNTGEATWKRPWLVVWYRAALALASLEGSGLPATMTSKVRCLHGTVEL